MRPRLNNSGMMKQSSSMILPFSRSNLELKGGDIIMEDTREVDGDEIARDMHFVKAILDVLHTASICDESFQCLSRDTLCDLVERAGEIVPRIDAFIQWAIPHQMRENRKRQEWEETERIIKMQKQEQEAQPVKLAPVLAMKPKTELPLGK
jgi:hypothetical protein